MSLPASAEAGRPAGRLHYVDWLRVLAVLLLFPFHSARVFDAGEAFYVKGGQTSVGLTWILSFIDRWHMPLLFALAGASTYLALGKRTAGRYLSERVRRLLVPLVFGFFVLIPPQTWLGARFNAGYGGSLWEYLASGRFLVWNVRGGGDYFGGFGLGHLWFILFLFVISMTALPVVLRYRVPRGAAASGPRAWLAQRSVAWWFVPPVALWIAEALPDLAGKNPFYYLAWFLLGFFAIRDEGFIAAAERLRLVALAAGAAICAAYVTTGSFRDSLPDPSVALSAVNVIGMLGAWSTVVGLLGVARRTLDRPSARLAYLAEASYPLYILHQTVIVVVAFCVVRVVGGAWTGFFAVLAASTLVTFALYEGVRRVSVLRALFGMKPVPTPAPERATA